MSDREDKEGPSEGKDSGVVRYISRQDLKDLIQANVDIAMSEYLGALDAPALWEAIKKHDKTLYGNGRPGIIEELAVLKPMVGKVEAHLKAFGDFEVQTKLDRQSFFSRFDKIEEDLGKGISSLQESIKPLASLYDKLTKGAAIVGVIGFIFGGVIVFLLEKGDKIVEFLRWLTTK